VRIKLSGQSQRGFAIPLFLKIFLAITLIVALALLAAIYVTSRQGKIAAEAQIDRDLKQISAALTSIKDSAQGIIEIKSNVVGSDQDLAQYFQVASGGDDLGLSSAAAPDADQGQSSMNDLLAERVTALSVDLGIVTDINGEVVARIPQEGEAVTESLAKDRLLSLVLESEDGQGASGFWQDHDKLYLAAAGPIVSGEDLVGYVLLAKLVDKKFADEIAAVSGSNAAIFLQDKGGLKLLGSSFNADASKALNDAVAREAAKLQQAMDGKARVDLVVDGRAFSGELQALEGADGKPAGALLGLTATAQSKSAFTNIQRAVNWTGIVALISALLASLFLTRALLKPIRRLADAADKAAAGDYTQQVDVKGNDEIGKLGHAFDSLLSSLREKEDMEGYVSNLGKFLPEPGSEASAAARVAPQLPAQRFAMTILGVDFRRFAQEIPIGQEQIALTQLASLHSEVVNIAHHFDARILEQSGSRILLGFGGEARHGRAVHALKAIQTRALAGQTSTAAFAMHDGNFVFGSLPNVDTQPASLGLGVAQIQRLLSETPAGQVLLGPGVAKQLASELGRDMPVAAGASGKKFYSLTSAEINDWPKLAEPEHDPNSTQMSGNETRVISGSVNESNAQRLAPGMRLGGRYEIQSVLGAGGMGVVYKAHDLELDDVVALKMLRGAALMDGEHLERLKSELKLARKITHANILRTHDFGDINGQPFISMEYVRGMTLRYLIEQSGKLPFSAGLRIAKQIAGGLQAAHAVGVLHRDIKPENVILEASGNAKLMDFGIARPIRRTQAGQTQPGMFVGTPNYSPPEALAGEEVDARSDIYSMGVMLCEMFCGKLPFNASNTMELYIAHSTLPPILPSTLWPDIPKPLEAIILRCLEKTAAARFASAAELLNELSALRA
jgi:eukaryotic-like serine/threonine-protein kinase